MPKVKKKTHKYYGRVRKDPEAFIVKHYAGDVTYQVTGTLEKNRDVLHDSLSLLINACGVKLLQEIFKEPEEKKR